MSNQQATSNLVITRTLNAPRDLVFQVWTDANHLAKWWGPTGMSIHVAKLDLRPGGMFHYSMKTPDGHEMWGKFVYNEISPPDKIVFTNSFSDPEGNSVRAPFAPNFPLEVQNILTFTEQDGKTILTLTGGPINATEEEVQFFAAMQESMQQGFAGTFNQLEAYLATQA
ncbi:SRPBCC family protein [Paenibacillus aestuarii]|uniref:SRPBCC domain-containing protein n=1 Tax=Paenibacillus aestuarii TaxID=516965 RepID=A0ABW0KDP7_9BACL|nr:SRPBCC domain-containing protein [Paenibacillus aestuarii]